MQYCRLLGWHAGPLDRETTDSFSPSASRLLAASLAYFLFNDSYPIFLLISDVCVKKENFLTYRMHVVSSGRLSFHRRIVPQKSHLFFVCLRFSFVIRETTDSISSSVSQPSPNPFACSLVHHCMTRHGMMMISDGVPYSLGLSQHVMMHICGICPARHLSLQSPCHMAHLLPFRLWTLRSENRSTLSGASQLLRNKWFSICQNATWVEYPWSLNNSDSLPATSQHDLNNVGC